MFCTLYTYLKYSNVKQYIYLISGNNEHCFIFGYMSWTPVTLSASTLELVISLFFSGKCCLGAQTWAIGMLIATGFYLLPSPSVDRAREYAYISTHSYLVNHQYVWQPPLTPTNALLSPLRPQHTVLDQALHGALLNPLWLGNPLGDLPLQKLVPSLGSGVPHRPVLLCVALLTPPRLQHPMPGCLCCLLSWMPFSPCSGPPLLPPQPLLIASGLKSLERKRERVRTKFLY